MAQRDIQVQLISKLFFYNIFVPVPFSALQLPLESLFIFINSTCSVLITLFQRLIY